VRVSAGLFEILFRAFPFEQVLEACRYYEKNPPFGNVIISHD
jgi:hypothetical protein